MRVEGLDGDGVGGGPERAFVGGKAVGGARVFVGAGWSGW